jgi:predicted nucleic acid-binding Zn ribbon protein
LRNGTQPQGVICLDTWCSTSCRNREVRVMNNIIYIVGAVVIVLVILSFVGLV